MNWATALAWITACEWNGRLLGIWRSRLGPGPWSIFMRSESGMLELWAIPGSGGGTLVGKRCERTIGETSHGSTTAQ